MALDIHGFERQYEQTLHVLQASALSERNKQLVRNFCDACLLRQVCGKVRLIRSINALVSLAKHLEKNFDAATRPDIERVLATLLQRRPAYSVETMSTYKRVLRRFLTYVHHSDEFPNVKAPDIVTWMTTHVKKRDRPMVKRSDLLTPPEIEMLLRHVRNERDRAFVSTLWEAGPRISEIGNLQVGHVTRTSNGYTLDITGKTGSRAPLVVSSAPYLDAWLAIHPYRDDPQAPLWCQAHDRKPMTYSTLRVTLQRLFARAGIKKPFHPHIFRHSRVTYVLANGIMNEQQAKTYFGWTPDSDMPGAAYAHLIDTDVNNAILRENNLAPHQEAKRELEPVKCRICGQLNPPRSDYCHKCAAVLNLARAYEHQQLHDLKEQLFTSMFKVMVERGLVDEAAREIHDAGLGTILKRLAQQVRETEQLQAVKKNITDVKQNEVTPTQQLPHNAAQNS